MLSFFFFFFLVRGVEKERKKAEEEEERKLLRRRLFFPSSPPLQTMYSIFPRFIRPLRALFLAPSASRAWNMSSRAIWSRGRPDSGRGKRGESEERKTEQCDDGGDDDVIDLLSISLFPPAPLCTPPPPLPSSSGARARPPHTVALVNQGDVVGLRERPVVVVAGGVGRVERRLQRDELRVSQRRLDRVGELGLEGLEVRGGGGHGFSFVKGGREAGGKERRRFWVLREKINKKVKKHAKQKS